MHADSAVRKGILHYGDEFVGFMEGWRGVLDDVTMPLDDGDDPREFCEKGRDHRALARGRM